MLSGFIAYRSDLSNVPFDYFSPCPGSLFLLLSLAPWAHLPNQLPAPKSLSWGLLLGDSKLKGGVIWG